MHCAVELSDLQMRLIINVALQLKSVAKYWAEQHMRSPFAFPFLRQTCKAIRSFRRSCFILLVWRCGLNEEEQVSPEWNISDQAAAASFYLHQDVVLALLLQRKCLLGGCRLDKFPMASSVCNCHCKRKKERKKRLDEAGKLPALLFYQQSGESHRFTHSWVGETWWYGRVAHSSQMA